MACKYCSRLGNLSSSKRADKPTLVIAAGAAGTAALAAYLNAKHHIVHDLRHARGGLAPTQDVLDYMTDRVIKKRVLVYHVWEDQALRNQPNHPFLIFEGKSWTYKEFFDAIIRVGNWLMNDLGIQPEEIVAIDGGNSPEYLMLWFALDAIGASISYINWNLTGAGLVHCAKVSTVSCHSGPRMRQSMIADGTVVVPNQTPHRGHRCQKQCRGQSN